MSFMVPLVRAAELDAIAAAIAAICRSEASARTPNAAKIHGDASGKMSFLPGLNAVEDREPTSRGEAFGQRKLRVCRCQRAPA